jgi:hypothetical protein
MPKYIGNVRKLDLKGSEISGEVQQDNLIRGLCQYKATYAIL